VLSRLILILALAGAVWGAPTAAVASPPAKSKLSLSVRGYVADDVGVFSAAFKAEMKDRLARIQEQSGVTVLLAASGGMPGMKTEDVAKALGKALGTSLEALGKTRKDWVVFMLNPGMREFSVAISVSAALPEGVDPREAIESIEKEAVLQSLAEEFAEPVAPYFKTDDWEGGMRAGVAAIERYLDDNAKTGPAQEAAPSPAEDGITT
jgi:uncharacterized membrane protein YgcG